MQASNPLDAYIASSIADALSSCPALAGRQHQLRLSTDTGTRFVNMCQAASAAGLAAYSNATHLCWHPVCGPWFALRGVLTIDAPGPSLDAPPVALPDLGLEAEAADLMRRLQAAGAVQRWQDTWRDWVQLRSIGARHTDARWTYCADQLEYHYTKQPSVLARAVQAHVSQLASACAGGA